MDDRHYRDYCLRLLQNFADMIGAEAARSSEDDPLRELAAGFEAIARGEDLYDRGPDLVARLFAGCPQLAPAFPREVLWFLGGDCLHFMPDEELSVFQALDDRRADAAAQGRVLDYHEEKAKLLKLQ